MSLRRVIPIPQEKDHEGITSDGLRWLDLLHQRVVDIRKVDVTLDPASVAAYTTVEESVTVKGLKTDDIILSVIKPTLEAGLGVLQGRVSAADTLAIQLINTTGSAIDAGSEVYTVIYIKNSKV